MSVIQLTLNRLFGKKYSSDYSSEFLSRILSRRITILWKVTRIFCRADFFAVYRNRITRRVFWLSTQIQFLITIFVCNPSESVSIVIQIIFKFVLIRLLQIQKYTINTDLDVDEIVLSRFGGTKIILSADDSSKDG